MTEINYIGENLLAGNLGRFFIFLSFFAGIAALIFYSRALNAPEKDQLKLRSRGRTLYIVQALSIVLVGVLLFKLILSHSFEYAYIFKHSSKLMPGKYIISSFWAGQEGSFLLWAMMIAVFGWIAMYTSRKLESGVMIVTSVALIFLMSMIMGVNFLGLNLGSDPFALLREVDVNAGADFFKNPAYLSMIIDGNGLNPLLENPWMVIHPPTLFMGYAAALFPFAFAFASLLQNDRRYWLKLTLPWIILSVCLLGIGLILGGAWAYQSLTFGGFWAWDPVENASLVPWLVLVASLHYVLLSYKRDKYHLGSYIFTLLGFLMVVYASYLTRSGVLGATSVHAFGDDGLTFQLYLFMFVFTAGPLYMLVKRRKSIPTNDLPNLMNRESMMLYGSIVILLSAFQIISTTSIPVFSKIFNTNIALASDVVGFYNSWQLPFAMMVALLLGLGHYLAYDKNDMKAFWKSIIYPVGIALVLAIGGYFLDGDMTLIHGIFLFLVSFAVLSSVAYLFKFISRKRNLSAALTHLGFSIFLLGVLITFSNTKVLQSKNAGSTQGNNVMLFKGQVKEVGGQLLSYTADREERDEVFYKIDFLQQDAEGNLALEYSIYPSIKYSESMGNVHNPDTRNLFKGDVFMYLTYAEDRSKRLPGGYVLTENKDVVLLDTLFIGGNEVIFDSLYFSQQGQDFLITAQMKVIDSANKTVNHPLTYKLTGNYAESGTIDVTGGRIRFEKVSEQAKTINVSIYEKQPEFIVMKVMFFPWIWVLWAGTIIMFSGLTLAFVKRVKRAKESRHEESKVAHHEGTRV